MILDNNLEFADAVSVAASAGTANIGDIIDLTTARDMGNGEPMYLVISVDTEIITGGSAGTIKFQLVSDSTTTIATDGSVSTSATAPSTGESTQTSAMVAAMPRPHRKSARAAVPPLGCTLMTRLRPSWRSRSARSGAPSREASTMAWLQTWARKLRRKSCIGTLARA